MDSTLAKGLAVIDWLARQGKDCRLIDVAEAMGVPRSNAHRTLKTLVECGWAVQDPVSSAYRASLRLVELGAQVTKAMDFKAVLRPFLVALAQEVGETIHLTVLDGADVVYLDKIDSAQPVAAYSQIGGRAAASCVASGKALLAERQLAREQLAALFGSLRAATPNSLTDFTALQAELTASRQRGYAENREEWRLGVCGQGAVVYNANAVAIAAIGITVPAIRYSRARARVLSVALLRCVRAASCALGHMG